MNTNTNANTNAQTLKKIIKEELPGLMKRDRKIRQWIIQLSKEQITENTNKIESKMESRFDRLLDELRRDREAQTAKWEEHNREWKEYTKKQDKKWEEQNKKWDEYNRKQDKKWEDHAGEWEEYTKKQDKKWEDHAGEWEEYTKKQDKKWEEQDKKWDENQEEIRKLIRAINVRYDTGIGALGARWGLRSEASFRNALKGILGDLGQKVEHIDDYDEEGVVFGRPSSVELDIIIKNSRLMICELKSSMSKADMFIFYKKAKFYEDKYKRKSDRLIVISPMVDDNAREVARELRIKIYSYADEIQEEF
jgi:hypothetical protein